MSAYRNLIAWQKAMDLVDETYRIARTFPKSETFVLSQQMRAAASSIPSNIAEGQGRFTRPECRQFLRHARGSTLELETQILIAQRQKFIDQATAEKLVRQAEEVGRLINGLIRFTEKSG
jgi:four helix bundle protein